MTSYQILVEQFYETHKVPMNPAKVKAIQAFAGILDWFEKEGCDARNAGNQALPSDFFLAFAESHFPKAPKAAKEIAQLLEEVWITGYQTSRKDKA